MKLLLIASLAFTMLFAIACGGDNGGKKGTTVNTPRPSNAASTDGGPKNFTKNGETYNFYSWQYKTESPYDGDDERNQQMRERKQDIERKYGISIQFVGDFSFNLTTLRQSAFQGKPLITGMKEGGLHTMMDTYLFNDVPGTCLEALSNHEDVYNFKDENKFNVYSQYDLCEYNDKLWYFIPIEIGVHFECGGNVLVFNKSILEANGYKAEDIYKMVDNKTWTWSKFEEVLVACTDTSKGIYGIERGNEALVMWSLANSNGTEFVELKYNDDGTKYDSFVYTGNKGDRLMEAYDEFLKLANTLKVMEPTYYNATNVTPLEHFLAGNVAFFYNGYSTNALKLISSNNGKGEQLSFEYGIVPWPMGPTNSKNEKTYNSFYPHLNPYCVFRGQANVKGSVQILCELYTPIYDADSTEAQELFDSEVELYTRDAKSQEYLRLVESSKTHFRVFMYSNAPCTVNNSTKLADVLFGKGEDAILNQEQNAKTYFQSIANVVNQAIYERSPYTWK